jgi:hypothetical protein
MMGELLTCCPANLLKPCIPGVVILPEEKNQYARLVGIVVQKK